MPIVLGNSLYPERANMDNCTAIAVAEGSEESDRDGIDRIPRCVIEAWRHLVDTGIAWQLQGWFSRTARQLIDEGIIIEKGE